MTLPSDAAIAAVEAGFLDTCEIAWPDKQGEYDPDTLDHPTIPGTIAWSGPCQYAEAGRQGRDLVRGGEAEIEAPYQVSIPRAVAPSPGLIVRITSVHPDGDPAVVGKVFIIRRVRYGTRMARRVLLCDLLEATATEPEPAP